jgi:hypothetical protein
VLFAVFTKAFAVNEGLLPMDPHMEKLFRYITLETGLVVGASLVVVGVLVPVRSRNVEANAFGPLEPSKTLSRHPCGHLAGSRLPDNPVEFLSQRSR